MDREAFERLFKMEALDVVDLQGKLQELVITGKASDTENQELKNVTEYLEARASIIPNRCEKDYVAGSRDS